MRIRQGTPAPVGKGVGLFKANAAFAHYERAVAYLKSVAKQRCRNLSIENGLGGHAERVDDKFHILHGGMKELRDALVDKQIDKGAEVLDFEGVDGNAYFLGRQLDKTKLWPIGFLAQEFGVDGKNG